jgi:hypothetical protein
MMRLAIPLALLAVAALTAAQPLSAQDLSGTWELSVETQRGTQTQTLVLVQEGARLAGRVTFSVGGRGGGGGSQTVEITDGVVEGNRFSFAVTRNARGGTISQSYAGTIEGDTMEDSMEGGRGGSQRFTGSRASTSRRALQRIP